MIFETFQMADNRVIEGWNIEALAGGKYGDNELRVDYEVSR